MISYFEHKQWSIRRNSLIVYTSCESPDYPFQYQRDNFVPRDPNLESNFAILISRRRFDVNFTDLKIQTIWLNLSKM
jgi:hypothetical protein